jgi:Fe-coproporphyrin III synthase
MKKTVSFSKNAVNVFFHILTGCNLSCRHCYINPDQHGQEPLPIETIEAWLATFARRSRQANVIFLGGEPTLHPDLSRAVKSARALGYTSITIDTNGYLFNDFLNRIRPDDVDFLSFSLDGATPETNDAIRGTGSFRRCTDGIREAVSKGFHTSLIYTVSRENLHELGQMPDLLKELKVERFFIQVIGIRGRSAASREIDVQVSVTEWLDTVPAVARQAADQGIVTTYPKVFLAPHEPFDCAGNVADNFFIFPNGRVYRCPLCEDFPIHAFEMKGDRLVKRPRINEADLFSLTIAEGCVMNRLIQPDNLSYDRQGRPRYQIACCLLKEEIRSA